MSYLLDALKQSQQADMSAEQYDLQSEQLNSNKHSLATGVSPLFWVAAWRPL